MQVEASDWETLLSIVPYIFRTAHLLQTLNLNLTSGFASPTENIPESLLLFSLRGNKGIKTTLNLEVSELNFVHEFRRLHSR